jgi:hypothetical protein
MQEPEAEIAASHRAVAAALRRHRPSSTPARKGEQVSNVSTVWLIIAAGIFVVAFALVANSSLAGITQIVVLVVLGIAALACFALMVMNAIGR